MQRSSRKRERENPCFVCFHYHDYANGEPCGVCGHAPACPSAPEQPQVKDSAFPSEVVPGFLYLGS
jgi:dual specificity MAP kinase phosphatase